MKCPEEIGIPLSIQIWHDNSGGKEAGWYLGKVVFVDLQQKRWFVVAVNKLLTLAKNRQLSVNFIVNSKLQFLVNFCKKNTR